MNRRKREGNRNPVQKAIELSIFHFNIDCLRAFIVSYHSMVAE